MVGLARETPFGRNQADTGNGIRGEAAGNWKQLQFDLECLQKGTSIEREHDFCRESLDVGKTLPQETPSRRKRASARQDLPQSQDLQRQLLKNIASSASVTVKFACPSTGHWRQTQLAGPTVKIAKFSKT